MADQPFDYSDLRALYINCTLTKPSDSSDTQTLIDRSRAVMRSAGVKTESIRAVDHDIAPGVYPDIRENGWLKGHPIPAHGNRVREWDAGEGFDYPNPEQRA